MNRPDFSEYVAHFTKGADHPRDSKDSRVSKFPAAAFDRLISILQSKTITAIKIPFTGKPAVCFTECPWMSLAQHGQQYSLYGVGFSKEKLFAADGGPVYYIRDDLFEKQKKHNTPANAPGIHPDVYPFLTPFRPKYDPGLGDQADTRDWTHEREWRVASDFQFDYDDVQFVVVETHEEFSKLPQQVRDGIGADKFIIMSVVRHIAKTWPGNSFPD